MAIDALKPPATIVRLGIVLSPPTQAKSTSVTLPSLTGLRGAAALWVILFHLSFVLGKLFHFSPDIPLIREGYLGVDVFFLLSGFILCHVYASDFQSYRPREHFHFLLMRLARIYPLHLFVLCLMALAVWLVPALPSTGEAYPRYTAKGFVISALLLQNWSKFPLVWNGPAWSLSAEWAAYMVFPFLLISLRLIKSGRRAIAFAVVSLALLASVFVVTGHSMNAMGPTVGFLRLAFEFTAGALLQRAGLLGLRHRIPWRFTDPLAVVLMIAALCYPPAAPLSVLFFGYLVFSLAESSFTGRQRLLERVLRSRAMMFLGEISFSLYLIQTLLLELTTWHIARHPPANPGEAAAIAAFPIVGLIVLPVLTYWAVEHPGRSIGRRLASHFRNQAVVSPAISISSVRISPQQASAR